MKKDLQQQTEVKKIERMSKTLKEKKPFELLKVKLTWISEDNWELTWKYNCDTFAEIMLF